MQNELNKFFVNADTYTMHGKIIPDFEGKSIPDFEAEQQAKEPTPMKFDQQKTDWSLMPFEAVEEINKVLEFGAKKYAAHNWCEGSGFKYSRVLNSLLRHVFAFMRGEDVDPESGLSHMAHAGCNVLFILYYLKHKNRYANDDRFKSQ